jgi:glutathione synthase/RimK-type ligase-like ATP-grasp enzyme
MTRIALIGPQDREEIQRLAVRLEERSAEPVFVDTRRPAAIRIDAAGEEACGVSLAGVTGVYVADLGLPPPRVASENGLVEVAASRAALAHSQSMWSAWRLLLERLARRAAVVNPPASYDVHGLKPLEIASYLAKGWCVPDTLSTDEPKALLELDPARAPHGRVRKDLVGGYGFTEVLDAPAHIEQARERVGDAALMAQERIEGDAVRAFVIGGRMLVAAEILPQGYGEIDSRRGTARVRRIEISGELCELSKAVAAHWNMSFAGVDWMRAAGGREWVLLECNSAPFFVEFERRTGADIGGALADHLLRRARRTKPTALSS